MPPQKRKDSSGASAEQFFLYTKLNENETKNLRKAHTNKEERRALASIFNLQTIPTPQNHNQINKMDLLLLDFHYINYEFCKENHFSNEKISTFLAIMDFLFHYMLEKQMLAEEGFKLLKKLLEKHSSQRPPFSILIFDTSDMLKIQHFTLKTFFRHYSLYEFAFKPRMELVLKCEPFLNNKFNVELCNLNEMQQVDQDEADRLKVYLGIFNQQLGELNLDQDPLNQNLDSDRPSTKRSLAGDQPEQNQKVEEQVDWKQVGKIYKEDQGIESILEREMNRLKKAMEKKIEAQDIELEEKVIASKGKKK